MMFRLVLLLLVFVAQTAQARCPGEADVVGSAVEVAPGAGHAFDMKHVDHSLGGGHLNVECEFTPTAAAKDELNTFRFEANEYNDKLGMAHGDLVHVYDQPRVVTISGCARDLENPTLYFHHVSGGDGNVKIHCQNL